MELEEFIRNSLVQVFKGVTAAKEEAKLCGFIINPHITGSGNTAELIARETKTPIKEVEFDIAVTAAEGKQTKGGAGIRVLSLDFGGERKSDTTNTTVSRIRFSVPIGFPRE